MTHRFAWVAAWFAAWAVLAPQPGSAAITKSTAQNDRDHAIARTAPAGNGTTQSARMPMYDAFKRFCIDTAAQPEVIAKAVMMSGISFHKRAPAATATPWAMNMTGWDMDFEGHALTLNAGNAMEASGAAMLRKSETCTITSWNNADEKASVAALHRWAGISRSADRSLPRGGGTLALYTFEMRGPVMLPLKEDDGGRLARAEGRTWLLTIMDNATSLTHYFPPTPRP